MRDLEHTTETDFDTTYSLMVKGPYFLAQVPPSTPPLKALAQLTHCRKQHHTSPRAAA
jgi:hypothetical protein